MLLVIYKITSKSAKGVGVDFHANIYCDVHGYLYECSGHPASFYTVTMMFTGLMLLAYSSITLYSLTWVSCPCLHKLTKLHTREGMKPMSKDLTFLVHLLAKGAGIAPALKALAILDKVNKSIRLTLNARSSGSP